MITVALMIPNKRTSRWSSRCFTRMLYTMLFSSFHPISHFFISHHVSGASHISVVYVPSDTPNSKQVAYDSREYHPICPSIEATSFFYSLSVRKEATGAKKVYRL